MQHALQLVHDDEISTSMLAVGRSCFQPMRASLPMFQAVASRSQHATCVPSISSLLASSSSQSSPAFQESVTVNGWIRSIRSQKRLSFIDLNDGSNYEGLQAVLPASVLSECDEGTRAGLSTGASVRLSGQLVDKKGGNQLGQELLVQQCTLVGGCDGKVRVTAGLRKRSPTDRYRQTYPIQKKEHSLPFLRRNAHLRARTSTTSSMLRMRDCMNRACAAYFHENGFLNATMPITTSSDCEGAGETFSITSRAASARSLKGKQREIVTEESQAASPERPVYLSVSGQLHQEAIVVGGGINRTWHLGPAFRAERSDTNRHLNEFWMCEAELAWTDAVNDVTQRVEELVKAIAVALVRESSKEMQAIFPKGWAIVADIHEHASSSWKRLTYTDAIFELQEAAEADPQLFQHRPSYDSGLHSEHERWLADKYGPTFVVDYPSSQKPFYMRKNGDAADTVACFDLLVPRIGELAGGSLREERLQELEAAMQAKGMKTEDYEWYLDLRRYGSVPHGGFGLGWERLVSWLLGIENVRECIPFPRASEGSRF